jgi:hypothetical protein
MKRAREACHAVPSARSWLRYSIAWPRSCWFEVGSEAIWMAFSTCRSNDCQYRAVKAGTCVHTWASISSAVSMRSKFCVFKGSR